MDTIPKASQIAKHYGAIVTGVCSTANVEMVKALGADSVIDYTREDFTKNGEQYDIIFDTVGKRTFGECKNSLSQNGVYLSSVIDFSLLVHMIWTSIFGSKKAKSSSTGMLPVKARLAYFLEIKELLKMGKIKTVIDQHFPLSINLDSKGYNSKNWQRTPIKHMEPAGRLPVLKFSRNGRSSKGS